LALTLPLGCGFDGQGTASEADEGGIPYDGSLPPHDSGGDDALGSSDGTTPDQASGADAPAAMDGGFDAAPEACVPKDCCAASGYDCGQCADGCGGQKSCGQCTTPNTCMGGGKVNVCGCTPSKSCPQDFCGSIDDGCGKQIDCGCGYAQCCVNSTCVQSCSCCGGTCVNSCGFFSAFCC
jgi:hypothetical protein